MAPSATHRSRSRSPDRPHHLHERRSSRRSRSPSRHHHHKHHHRRHRHHDGSTDEGMRSGNRLGEAVEEEPLPARPSILPNRATPLSKYDLDSYRAVFASYLDIQKQKLLEDLDEREVKGRWKSFVGKWNRGELAEGWYDPTTKEKTDASYAAAQEEARLEALTEDKSRRRNSSNSPAETRNDRDEPGADDDSDDYGPTLPSGLGSVSRVGPAPATAADLAYRDEALAEDRAAGLSGLRNERRADRRQQKEQLDELVPRAEPGTKERQMEKRRENAAANRAFRDAGEGGVGEVAEGELMGSGDVDEVKTRKKEVERKKNEREVRKEEMLRVRAAEREERLKGMRVREDQTMSMLKAIAKERFG